MEAWRRNNCAKCACACVRVCVRACVRAWLRACVLAYSECDVFSLFIAQVLLLMECVADIAAVREKYAKHLVVGVVGTSTACARTW